MTQGDEKTLADIAKEPIQWDEMSSASETVAGLLSGSSDEQGEIALSGAPAEIEEADTNRLLDSLPMEFRPPANVPGRNRKEKRTYRKLATLAERGTIRKHAAMRLKRLYVELVRAGKIKK